MTNHEASWVLTVDRRRKNAFDPRGHDSVAFLDIGAARYVIEPEPVLGADHDTLDARALDQRARGGGRMGWTIRPTTPVGAMTAMSGRSPSSVPLSIVIVRNSELAPPPITRAATVFSGTSRRSCRRS